MHGNRIKRTLLGATTKAIKQNKMEENASRFGMTEKKTKLTERESADK